VSCPCSQDDLNKQRLYTFNSKEVFQFKFSVYYETVRPKVIYDFTKFFIENSDLYKEEGVTLDNEWYKEEQNNKEITFSSVEDIASLQTEDTDKEKQESTEEDSWNELTDEEQAGAGNKDTLMQNVDFADDCLHALQIAPGEKNHPISLFMDTFAKEKSFPILFCGSKRIENVEWTVPVTYSSICKAEFKNVDTRFSKSVPNMFFKITGIASKRFGYNCSQKI